MKKCQTPNIEIRSNLNFKLPHAFPKDAVVCLTKDTHDYYLEDDGLDDQDPYYRKDCKFMVIECGWSKVYVIETKTGEILKPVENDSEELCFVESLSNDLGEIEFVEGLIKAADLQECTI